MIKSVFVFIIFSFLVTWGISFYSFFLSLLLKVYAFFVSQMDIIFTGSTVGNFLKNAIALLLVSGLAASLPTAFTILVIRKKITQFTEMLFLFMALTSATIALNPPHMLTQTTS